MGYEVGWLQKHSQKGYNLERNGRQVKQKTGNIYLLIYLFIGNY